MDSQTQSLMQLASALPVHIDFYHLGTVEQKTTNDSNTFRDACGVAFKIYGDLNGLMIVLFENDLDHSTYTELGNLLASRLATRLQVENALDVMISPPQRIEASLVQSLTQKNSSIIRRTYAHFYKNSVISVETLVLSAQSEGIGYA